MSATVTIKLTDEAQGILRSIKGMTEGMSRAVARGMDQANQIAKTRIENQHLTGKGPFPVSQHKLGVKSGLLRKSTWANKARVNGNTISSAIGSNVIYAAIHEFGGVIHKDAKSGSVRLRVDRHGALFRQPGFAHLAIFARPQHKAREVKTKIKAHDITMPERAPFRTGIAESAADYTREISAAIVNTWHSRA